MLHLLDESLENMLRATMPIAKSEVDVAFDAPDNEWAGRITKPTLNLFLWDIRRSTDEAEGGRERVTQGGREAWRARPPRMAFSYLVTAWTSESRDEHRLLGSALVALLAHTTVEEEHQVDALRLAGAAPTLKVARPQAKDFAEFWSAIDGQLKPGLDLTVTASVDPGVFQAAGPPTTEFDVKIVDRTVPGRVSQRKRMGGHIDDPLAVGAEVTSPHGKAYVDANGNFLIPAEPGDTLTIHLADPLTQVAGG